MVSVRTSLPRQNHEMGRVDLNSFIILLKPDQVIRSGCLRHALLKTSQRTVTDPLRKPILSSSANSDPRPGPCQHLGPFPQPPAAGVLKLREATDAAPRLRVPAQAAPVCAPAPTPPKHPSMLGSETPSLPPHSCPCWSTGCFRGVPRGVPEPSLRADIACVSVSPPVRLSCSPEWHPARGLAHSRHLAKVG